MNDTLFYDTQVHQENESFSSKQDRKESQDLIHLQAENAALQKYIKGSIFKLNLAYNYLGFYYWQVYKNKHIQVMIAMKERVVQLMYI